MELLLLVWQSSKALVDLVAAIYLGVMENIILGVLLDLLSTFDYQLLYARGGEYFSENISDTLT